MRGTRTLVVFSSFPSAFPAEFILGVARRVAVKCVKDALKAGWNGQGSLIFNFAGFPLALRAVLNYNKFTFKNDLPFTPGGAGAGITTTDDITQQIIGGLANITISVPHGSNLAVRDGRLGWLQHQDQGSATP